MRLPFTDRRQLSGNEALNLAVIQVLGAVLLILSLGSIVLAGNRLETPEWIGNTVSMLVGGLVGYLAKELKHAPTVTTTGPVEQVTVEQPQAAAVGFTPDPLDPVVSEERQP